MTVRSERFVECDRCQHREPLPLPEGHGWKTKRWTDHTCPTCQNSAQLSFEEAS